MKYALHASLHKPVRRPDQTARGLVNDADASRATPAALPEPEAPLAQGTEVPAPLPPPPSFLPPRPTLRRNAQGKPAFLPPPPTVFTAAHDRPTLRFPAVPPPLPQSTAPSGVPVAAPNAETRPAPIIDVNEPTLEDKPVTTPMNAVSLDELDDDVRELVERARNATRVALAPTAEAPAAAASTSVASIAPLRPRKKGTPPPPNRELHHDLPPIDPAAWLADEAHARSSDHRDSADGVDPSDTIVPVPTPHHPWV